MNGLIVQRVLSTLRTKDARSKAKTLLNSWWQAEYNAERNFVQIILENLKTAGVQQAHKQDRIGFTALTPWPGELVCAEGRYAEGDAEKRAAIFIGPEFGTVARPDLVAAAREAGARYITIGFESLLM